MISIIIPAFNEEDRIPKTLGKIADYVKKDPDNFEVIVVDDASTDKTSEQSKKFSDKIRNLKVLTLGKSPFAGKGYAVNKGVLASSGDLILFTDADGSTPIEELDKLTGKIDDGFDIAIGSRAIARESVKKKQGFLREYMGRTFNILVQTLTVKGIVDTQCGFKLFRRDKSLEIFKNQKIFDFGFDVELLFAATKRGLKISEVPVLWFNDPKSSVDPVKDSIKMLFDLFKIRLYYSEKDGPILDKLFFIAYKYKTFWKFSIVGATNTVVDIAALYILTRYFGVGSISANLISVEIAIIWSFTWNSIWTFSKRNTNDSLIKRLLIFQFVSLGGYVVNQIMFLVFFEVFGILDLIAKVLTVPFTLVFNYILNSRWTFRDASAGKASWYYYSVLILILFVFYFWLTQVIEVPFFGR